MSQEVNICQGTYGVYSLHHNGRGNILYMDTHVGSVVEGNIVDIANVFEIKKAFGTMQYKYKDVRGILRTVVQ